MKKISMKSSWRVFLLTGIFLLLAIQGLTRFAVHPPVGFVLDDWSLWSDALNGESLWTVSRNALLNPTRPVGACIQQVASRLLLDRMPWYGMLAWGNYSLMLLLVFLLVREVTDRTELAFVAGAVFAVLPNLCGQFHWLCMIIGIGQPCYLVSAWLLARYVRRGTRRSLWGAVFWYALALGNYEVGVFLPAAYAVLLWGRGWKKCLMALMPFGLALGVYAAWRLTAGFGLGRGVGVAPQFTPRLSGYALKHTAADIVSWWAGLDWWRAIGDGATGFSELPWIQATLLLLANGMLVALSGWWLWKAQSVEMPAPSQEKTRDNPFGNATLALFGVAWVAATYLPAFLGYMAPRLNYLPGAGVAFLVALAAGRMKLERWLGLVLGVVFAGMVVGEGDTKNWGDSIRFQENLFQTMKEHRADWQDSEVLCLDTRELSNRLTPGLVAPNCHHIDTVAEYRNAGLLRGFGPSAMAELILKERPGPRVVLDVEYGAHEENGVLKWHERYDPSKPFETPMDRVYRLDVLSAGTRSSADARD